MTRQVRAASPEASVVTAGDLARTESSVSDLRNRTVSDAAARLLEAVETLARVAADVTVTLHTPPPPVVIQPAVSETRVAWTVAEFAKAHGLAKGTVYELIKRGELLAGRVNESLRISETERLRWWAERERQHAEELGLAS